MDRAVSGRIRLRREHGRGEPYRADDLFSNFIIHLLRRKRDQYGKRSDRRPPRRRRQAAGGVPTHFYRAALRARGDGAFRRDRVFSARADHGATEPQRGTQAGHAAAFLPHAGA